MTDIRVPTLGESVTEATVGKWFKQPGDAVAVDEPLVELETDKVTLEVPAPAAGILGEIAAKNGETVGVGAILGMIKDGAGAAVKAVRPLAARRAAPTSSKQPPLRSTLPKKSRSSRNPRRRSTRRSRRRSKSSPPKVASIRPRSMARAGTVRSPKATCWRRLNAPPPRQPRSPRRCRCGRHRRPTMPRAKSACT